MFIDYRKKKRKINKGRERERETSIHYLWYVSWSGIKLSNLQHMHVPWPGIVPTKVFCMGQCSNKLNHPAKAQKTILSLQDYVQTIPQGLK